MIMVRESLLAGTCLAVVFYCLLMDSAPGQTTGLDALYVQQNGGAIDNINTVTGTSVNLAAFPTDYWNGAAYDHQNGLLYIDNIGEANFTTNQVITNTIYSFNPLNPGAGVTEVGTIAGQSAFTGAGFYNGLYYTIGTGSNQLEAYNLSAAGGPKLVSSQTLGGLGSGITGLSLGDIDFVGNSLWVSAGTLTSTAAGAGVSSTYTLYHYTNVSNVTTPVLAVSEGTEIGVGIAYDYIRGQLIAFNSDGTIAQVNQSTGAESGSITLSGPAFTNAGAGDFAIVPEPGTYALWSMGLVFSLVFAHRALRQRSIASV